MALLNLQKPIKNIDTFLQNDIVSTGFELRSFLFVIFYEEDDSRSFAGEVNCNYSGRHRGTKTQRHKEK